MSLNLLTDLGIEYAISGGLLVVRQNTGGGGSSLWDTTDKPIIEAEIANKQNKVFVTVGKNDTTADYNTADYADDISCIKAAVEFANQNKIKEIRLSNDTFNCVAGSPRIQIYSKLKILGGTQTKIVGTRQSDWLFRNNSTNGSNVVDSFVIENIEFDLQNTTAGSCIAFLDCINSGVKNCTFKNGAAAGWFVKFGTENSATSTFFGEDNFSEGCVYDTHQGSLEMLLVYNQKNFRGAGTNTFLSKGTITTGPVFGLWQNCENTVFENLVVKNCKGFSYYSNSTNHTTINNYYLENSGCALQGANISDNTIFGPVGGIQRAIGIRVKSITAIGGVNSVNSSCIELGSVSEYSINIDLIQDYQVGIKFHNGNNSNDAEPIFGNIKSGVIKNCNPSNANADLSPAFLFTRGGNYNLTVTDVSVYDDRTTKLMIQPVFFELSTGNETYNNISFINCSLPAYSGRNTLKKNSSVILSNSVQFINCRDVIKGTDSRYYDTIYSSVSVQKLITSTSNPANINTSVDLQIGGAGTTNRLRFGDSADMRGESGNLAIFSLFTGKKVSFKNSSLVEQSSIAFDTGKATFKQLNLSNLATHADNAAATLAGLVAGDVYKTPTGELKIVI